jgi:Tfp pilus assembly protein PilO
LKEQQPEASLSKAVKQTDDQADKLADAFAKLSQLPSGAELNSLISNVTSVRQQLEKSLESS